MKNSDNESLKRIFETAERLFSSNGFHGTSVRDVTKKAHVNLAAVNYHFGSKESLYCEILRQRLGSMNRDRLAKFRNATELAGNEPIPLALIIDLFARPLFEADAGARGENGHLSRLIGRSITEPLPFAQELIASELHSTTAVFARAIRKHVPTLRAGEFMWRLNFVVGAMHHTLATIHQMSVLTHGICRSNDLEDALRNFTRFAVGTFTTSSSNS